MVFIISPKETYIWTHHAHQKMRHYRLTESRIKRIIRFPSRIEEGVIEDGIACMQSAGGKTYSEIWAMYVLENEKRPPEADSPLAEKTSSPSQSAFGGKSEKQEEENVMPEKFQQILSSSAARIKIITCWRYPGKSPSRDPIPSHILKEIQMLL